MATCNRLDGVENLSTGGNDSCDTCGEDEALRHRKAPSYNRSEGGGYFSFSECDSCGSTVAGQRYPAHGHITVEQRYGSTCFATQDWRHFDVCEDCAMAIDA
jgi:hypothetical protein